MKIAKLALIPLALVAGSAFATDANVTAANSSQKVTYEITAGNFVATKFDFNVSANVGLKSKENETAIAVQTANTKGRNNYSGSSEGGSVSQCGNPTTGSTAPTVREPVLANANGCNAGSTP